MTAPAFDPEDWFPEDGYVGIDPLNMESLDEKWTQFYIDRMVTQAERKLKEEAENEEG